MSWLDNILGEDSDDSNNNNSNNSNKNTTLNDKDIALEMLVSSKFNIEVLAKSITETINPQLRQILNSQLNMSINEHFRLSDMAINKQWYNTHDNPQQQIQQVIQEVESLSQQ
jgi:similar to spore coat protein